MVSFVLLVAGQEEMPQAKVMSPCVSSKRAIGINRVCVHAYIRFLKEL